MFPFAERIGPVLVQAVFAGLIPQKERRALGPDLLGIVAGLVVDGQQVIAVLQDDRPVADHVPSSSESTEASDQVSAPSRETFTCTREVDQVSPNRTT